MKILNHRFYFPLFLICVFLIPFQSFSMIDWDDDGNKKDRKEMWDKIAQIKKIKMLEILDLDEESANKFLAAYTAHEDKVKEAFIAYKNTMKELKEMLDNDKTTAEIKGMNEKVLEAAKNWGESMRNKNNEIRNLLNPEQFAKYLVFESDFYKEMGKHIKRMKNDRRKK